MSLLRQIVPSLIVKSLKSPWQLCCFNPCPETSHLIHTVTKPTAPNNVVKAICNAFRSGWTWDTLSREFHHIEFNEQLIEKILLELKQPIDAKWALGFFHWAAHRVNFQHCLRTYCLAIHILVRARLNLDARALIETVLKKNAGDPSKFLVVDSLLSCYKITDSNPFVFDLLVQSYSRLRMFDSGFDVCCYLEEHGFSLNLGYTRQLKKVNKEMDKVLEEIIAEHEEVGRYKQGHHDDFIDVLLSLMNQPMNPQDRENVFIIDRTNVKAILVDLLTAALDTSSASIEWTLSELIGLVLLQLFLS